MLSDTNWNLLGRSGQPQPNQILDSYILFFFDRS
jgi:hypothetical protein